jgi:DNA-binding response OmpR family regulator
MSQGHQLAGATILVAEDDFYLADDACAWLEAVGARVAGPFPSVTKAGAVVRDARFDGAVLDVSLSDGPSFDIARTLQSRGIPVVFVTGYDASAIPGDLAGVKTLTKPVARHDLITTIADLVGTSRVLG